LTSIGRKINVNTMPPRRRVDPPVANRAMEREMRELCVRLDAMETTQRRTPDVGDVSEAEIKNVEVEAEAVVEDVVEEHLLRVVVKLGARANIDITMYKGNLDTKEFLDWIQVMDKYFDYEDVEEEKKVRHVVTRLKGHAVLWWDELQVDRRSKGKQKIKRWDRMVAKLKVKFMPKDYQINLFRRMQNLRQRGLTVKEYTEEFYKLNIRAGQRERDEEKFVRYINGLRYKIQDDQYGDSQDCIRCISDGIEGKEKLARKQSQQNKGRNLNRGKGVAKRKHRSPRIRWRNHIVTLREEEFPEEDTVVVEVLFPEEEEAGGEVRCYACGKTRHKS
jgi:hypothetical protein